MTETKNVSKALKIFNFEVIVFNLMTEEVKCKNHICKHGLMEKKEVQVAVEFFQ